MTTLAYYERRPKVVEKYSTQATSIPCPVVMNQAKATKTAFTAKDNRSRPKKQWSLKELIGKDVKHKFRLCRWDGRYVEMPLAYLI